MDIHAPCLTQYQKVGNGTPEQDRRARFGASPGETQGVPLVMSVEWSYAMAFYAAPVGWLHSLRLAPSSNN
jgi:hypothetical protein